MDFDIAQIASESKTVVQPGGSATSVVDGAAVVVNTENKNGEGASEDANNQQNAGEQAAGDVVVTSKWWEELGGVSGNTFKTEDEAKTFIAKAKDYDTLNNQLTELQGKAGETKFADDFERLRNEIKLNGGTKEQLKTLEDLNELGSLDKLTPFEITVNKLIMVDGIPRKNAEMIAAKSYGIDLSTKDEDLTETERADLVHKEYENKSKTKEDLEALSSFKVDVESIKNTDGSNKKIMSESEKIHFNNTISTLSSELKVNFTGVNPIKQMVTLVDGQEPVEFEHSLQVPAEFKEDIPELMSNYFKDTNKPINQETLGEFLDYMDKAVWMTYGAKMLENAVASAVMKTHKDLVAKYENLSGGKQKSAIEFGNMSDSSAFNGFADSIVS